MQLDVQGTCRMAASDTGSASTAVVPPAGGATAAAAAGRGGIAVVVDDDDDDDGDAMFAEATAGAGSGPAPGSSTAHLVRVAEVRGFVTWAQMSCLVYFFPARAGGPA